MEIINQTQEIIEKVKEGLITEIDALVELRKIKSQAEIALASIKSFEEENLDTIANQASEYMNSYGGYNIIMVQGRKTYDYSKIEEYKEAKYHLKSVEEKYKAMLDAKLKGAVHANVTEDGEELTLPEINYGKGYLRVTASKK
jgi:hypothetical protein